MSEWISVEDKLPEINAKKESGYILIYDGMVNSGFMGEWKGEIVFYNYDYIILDNVTHWMPLPEPPKC